MARYQPGVRARRGADEKTQTSMTWNKGKLLFELRKNGPRATEIPELALSSFFPPRPGEPHAKALLLIDQDAIARKRRIPADWKSVAQGESSAARHTRSASRAHLLQQAQAKRSSPHVSFVHPPKDASATFASGFWKKPTARQVRLRRNARALCWSRLRKRGRAKTSEKSDEVLSCCDHENASTATRGKRGVRIVTSNRTTHGSQRHRQRKRAEQKALSAIGRSQPPHRTETLRAGYWESEFSILEPVRAKRPPHVRQEDVDWSSKSAPAL